MISTLKPATVEDLYNLCVNLRAHGLFDAELTFNSGEYGVYLNAFGNVDYDSWSSPTSSKKFVDIQP